MQAKPAYALIADDDRALGLSLRHMFATTCGHPCDVLQDITQAFEQICHPNSGINVILLGRSNVSRPQAIAEIKAKTSVFIMTLHRESDGDSLEGCLLAGADDAVRAPFSLHEIALRLRHRIGFCAGAEHEALFKHSDSWSRRAYATGRAGLTEAEAQVFDVLLRQVDQIVSRDALSLEIDGRPWDYGDRKFDVHVASIRKKLTAEFSDQISVKTIRSAGYVLSLGPQGDESLLKFGV